MWVKTFTYSMTIMLDKISVASINTTFLAKNIYISIRDSDDQDIHVIYDETGHNSPYLSITDSNVRQSHQTKLRVTCSANVNIANAILIIDYEII